VLQADIIPSATPITRLHAQPDASSCSPVAMACGAEEAPSTNLLTKCSPDCLSHVVDLLRPVNDASLTALPTSLQFLADTSLDPSKSCSF
jgi:hypothetical protein